MSHLRTLLAPELLGVSTFPRLMYSYRPAREDISRETQILLENKLWFSTPDQFNDPFELRPHFAFAQGYEPEAEALESLRKSLPEWLSKRVIEELLARFRNPQRRAEMERGLRQELLDMLATTSIACFAESETQIRMWSYYATSHRGVCFGFDFNVPWLHKLGQLVPEQVIYQEQYPQIELRATGGQRHPDEDLRKKALLAKALEWSGEREWRCLRYKTPSGLQPFPAESLKTLTFGARVDALRRDELLRIVANRSTPLEVFQAFPARDKFEIELKRIE